MLNPARTIELIKGALVNPEATWSNYLPEADDWKKTCLLLTGPLIVISNLLSYLIGLFMSSTSMFGFRLNIMYTLSGMIMSAITAGVVAIIVSGFAGMHGGKESFSRGLAATSLAFVPGYLGQALNWIPGIGRFIYLGLLIYSLVLLWRIIPVYMGVPNNKRTSHFILTLISTAISMVMISIATRPIMDFVVSG